MVYLFLLIGLALLIAGGEFLVKGAVGLSIRLKIPTIVIGMTIVAFGTSAPELLVSLKAASTGNPGIAIGNVLGSNVANIALVLGITAIIFPIVVTRSVKFFDWPVMMLSTGLLFISILDGVITFWESLVMFTLLLILNIYVFYKSSKSSSPEIDDVDTAVKPIYLSVIFLVGGCAGLVFGAQVLLDSAVKIAKVLGMTDSQIGSTIVAFGTSVPELAASCIAAYRRQTDISIGNLIGSNIFNILCILGITGMVKDIPVDANVISGDIYWVIGSALLLIPMLYFGKSVNRLKGSLLFLFYLYFVFIVLK